MKRKLMAGVLVLLIGWWLWQEGEAWLTPADSIAVTGFTEPQQQQLYVYISGAVAKPGLYTFAEPVRVGEALASAGNILAYGDAASLNLAEPIRDGQQIHVPYQLDGVPGGSSAVDDGLISLNEADEEKLQTLPGIGPSMAKRIVEHRLEHGPFTAVEDLQKVKGIGPSKFKDLQDKVKL